ncbi:MAG: hypothetical protein IT254_02425 [Chitinophagaceae bacterium]|nr:hypothetical protein [Bacteroidota bacterium]MCC6257156.1 hypothetical protein [Chitinophagaceae bacterium]
MALLTGIFMVSCKKENTTAQNTSPKINFIFHFDSTQARLNALGQEVTVGSGNGAQSPVFNKMSSHYVELAPDQFTALGAGQVLYKSAETTAGGSRAIDFSQSKLAGQDEVFLSVPVSGVAAGTYNWLRVSLAYQNYNIQYRFMNQLLQGTLASFIGFNTYLTTYKVKDSSLTVNGNRSQGYWAFESNYLGYGFVSSGQAPAGATTVPNPLFASSPIPAGSCVVTGMFASPLVITGNETSDINIRVSLSTNKSFEWTEVANPGTYDPADGDVPVDMGIRGMIPKVL